MRKEEQPIVERLSERLKALAYHLTHQPLTIADDQDIATITQAASTIERLKGERDRWEKHATTGDGVLERTGAKLTTAESEASALRKRVEELESALRHLLDMIDVQDRLHTPRPSRETSDDENSRDERDQVFGDAIEAARRTLTAGGKDG